jgi:hypothetical protein
MRRFEDRDARTWDVVVGRASWGANYALFVPVDAGPEEIRQAPLRGAGFDEAAAELDNLDEDGLQVLLDNSEIRTE